MKPTPGETLRDSAKVSPSTIRRLSKYYRVLGENIAKGTASVSSSELANALGITSAQVRKDLSLFGSFGKRGSGYPAQDLKQKIAWILGLDRSWSVAVIGAGNIGTALIGYGEFEAHGFHVRLLFDNDPAKIGKKIKSLVVKDIANAADECKNEKIEIAVLAVPREAAQAAADQVIRSGVRAILNFAPCHINVPQEVTVRQENTAMELEALSFAITHELFHKKNED